MPNNKQGSSKKSSSADSKILQVRSHSSSHHQQTRSQQGSSNRAKGAQARNQQNSSHQQHRQQQPTIAQQHAKVLQQAKLLLAAAPAKAAAAKCPPRAKASPPKIRLVSPLEQLARAQAQAQGQGQQALLQGQAEAQLRATPTPLLDGLLQQMASTEEQALDLVARLRLKVAALKRMRMHGYAAAEDLDGGEQEALDGPAKVEARAEGEEVKDTDRPEAEKETYSQEQVAKAEGEIEQVTRNTNKQADNRRDDQVTLSEEAEKEGIGDKKATPGSNSEGVSGERSDDGAEAGPSKPGGRCCTAQCSPRGQAQAQAQAQAMSHCRFPEAAMECLLRAAERGAQLTSSALKALRAAERQLMQEEASSGPWAPVVACGSEAKSRAARAEDACLCVEEALREVMRCFRAYGALESALPDFEAASPPADPGVATEAPAQAAQRHHRSCSTSAVGGRKRRRKTESELQKLQFPQLHSVAVETTKTDDKEEIKKRQKGGVAERPASSEGVPRRPRTSESVAGRPASSDGSHRGAVFRAEASATGSSGSSSSAPSAGLTGSEGSTSAPGSTESAGSPLSAWSTRSTGLASALVGDVADSAVLTVARLLHRAIARCFPHGVKVTLAQEEDPPSVAPGAQSRYRPTQRLVQQILQILNAGRPLPGSPESTDSDEAESLLAMKRKIIKEIKKAKKEKAEQAAKAAAVMQMPSLSAQKIALGTSSRFGKKPLRKEDLIINVFEEKCRQLVVEAKTKAESSSPKSKRSEIAPISEACKGEGPGDVVPDAEQLEKRRKDRRRESGEDAARTTKSEGEENEGTWCYLNNMATLLKTDSKIRFSLIESCAKTVSPLSTPKKSEKSQEGDDLLRTEASEFEKEENSVQYDNITSDLFIDGASLWKILSQNKNMKVSYQKLREATTELAMGVAGAWDLQEDKKEEQVEKFLRQGARKKRQTVVTPLLVELVEPVDLGETYVPPEGAKRGFEDNVTKAEGAVKKQKYKLQLVKRDTDTGDARCKDEAKAKVVAAAIYQERTKRDRGATDVGTEDVAPWKVLIAKETKPTKEMRDEVAVSDIPARKATDSARKSAEAGHPSEKRERIKVWEEDAVSDSPARKATDSARKSAEAGHPSEKREKIKEVWEEDAVSDSPARKATDSACKSAEAGHPSEKREKIKEVRDEVAVSDSPARKATDSARKSTEAGYPSEKRERIKEVWGEDAVSDSPARKATDSARKSTEAGYPSEKREKIKVWDEEAVSDILARKATDSARKITEAGHPREKREKIKVWDEDAVSDSPARKATDSARKSTEAGHPSEKREKIKVWDEEAVSDIPARKATDSARKSAEAGHPSEKRERIKEVRDEVAVSDSPARKATDSARKSVEAGHPREKAREGSPSSAEKAKEREKPIARVEKSKGVSSPVESKHAEKKNLESSPRRLSKEHVESSTKKSAPDTSKPKSPKAAAGPSVPERASPSGMGYSRLIRSALAASPSRGYAKKPIKGRWMRSAPRRRSAWNSTSEDESERRPPASAGRRKAQVSATPRPAAATSQRPKTSKPPRFKPPKPKSPPASEISILKSKSHCFSETSVLRCASPGPAEIRATKSKSPAASELCVPRPSSPRTPEIQVIHYRSPDARRKQKSPVQSNMVAPKIKSPATSDVRVAKPKSPVVPGSRVSKLKSPTPSDGQMTKRSKSGQASKSPGGKSSSPVNSREGRCEAHLNASPRFWKYPPSVAADNSPRRHENKSSNNKENSSRKSFAPGKILAISQLPRGRANYTKSDSRNRNKTSEKTTIYYENKTFKADKSAEKKSAGYRGREGAEYDRRNKQKHEKNVSYKKQGPKVAKDGFAVLLNKGFTTPNSTSASTIGEALSKGWEDSHRELFRSGSWKTISTDRNSMLVEHKSGVGEKTQNVVVEDALDTVSLKKSVHKDTEGEVTEEQGIQMTDGCVLQTEILNDENTYQDVYDTSYDNEADIPVPKKVIVEECDFYEQFNQYQIEAIENIAPWTSNLVCDEYEFEEELTIEEEDGGEMISNDPLINTEATHIPEEDVEDVSCLRKEIEEWIASFPPLGQRSDKEVAYIPGDLEAVPEYTDWDNVDRVPEAWEAESEIAPGWGYTWTDESSPKADVTADATMDEAFENMIRALTERHENRPPQTPSEGTDSEKAASEMSERIEASNNAADPFCSTCRSTKEGKTEGVETQMPKQEEPFKDDDVDITKIVNALFNDNGMHAIEEESTCRCGEDDSDDESTQAATISDFKSAENLSKEKIDVGAEDEERSPKEDFDDVLVNRLGEIRKTTADRGGNEKIITEIMETLKKMKVYETQDDSPPEPILAQPVQDDMFHRYTNLSMSPASDFKTSGILHLPSAESGPDTRKNPPPEGRTKLPFLFADSSKGLLAQFGAMRLLRAGARKSFGSTLSSSQRTICEIEEEEEPPEDASSSAERPRETTSKPQQPEERSHLGNAISKEEVDLEVQAADTEIMRVTEVVNAMKEAFKTKSQPGAKFTAEEVHDAIKRADEVIRKASAIERKLTDVIRSVASGERPMSGSPLRPSPRPDASSSLLLLLPPTSPAPSDPAARVPSCPPSGPSTGPSSRQGQGPRAAAEGGVGGAEASSLTLVIVEDDAYADADGELSELPSDASEIFSESGSGASLSDSSDSRPPSSDSSLQECEGSAAPAALAAFRSHLVRDGLALQLRPVADCPHAHSPHRAYRPRHRAAAALLGVTVEASGANEEAAELRATLVLAAELARRQVEGSLPPQLTPFADDELLQLAALARREAGSAGAETCLRAECQRRGRSPPRFTLLPPSPSEGATPLATAMGNAGWGGAALASDAGERPAYAVRCTALDLEAYGTGAHRQSARRAAAHEMLELLERQRQACELAPHLGSNLVLLP